jgi:hypothetical protein
MCTLNERYLEGVNRPASSFSLRRMALVQRYTYLRRATSALTSRPISGYISGSPPGIETMGAPHSSTAARHCSTVRCLRRTWPGYWTLPQPAQARLQRNRGSSIRTSG